jgi:hypothetical protein
MSRSGAEDRARGAGWGLCVVLSLFPEKDLTVKKGIGVFDEATESVVVRAWRNSPGGEIYDSAELNRLAMDRIVHADRSVDVAKLGMWR